MHRVLVLGAYGFFGTRISTVLARDPQIELTLAGRDAQKATALSYQLGLRAENARAVDAHDARLGSLLKKLGIHTLIHTAGPFQGQDYAVAKACIAAGTNYLDLADGRAFVAGITSLDAAARAAGVCVMSGASTVPALSSAVMDRYREHFKRVESVAMGISSGGRVPGAATLRAVFSYCGKPFPTLEAGQWKPVHGWLDERTHTFPRPIGERLLGRCDIPDLTLFPLRYPTLKTVAFHAGFASHTGHRVVSWIARQVQRGRFKSAVPFAGALFKIGRVLEPLLSDSGGMFVTMTGPDDDDRMRSLTWYVVASENHGPYIPCGAAIALTHKLAHGKAPAPGARPCMGALTVKEYLEPLRDLRIREIAPPVATV